MAKMLLGFLCIVMTVGPVTSKIDRIYANKHFFRPGENILLTCEFSDFDAHDLTHFYKNFPLNKTTALTNGYFLADNLLDATGRFNFNYTDSTSTRFTTQTLGILNAVVGDSGNYSCYMRDVSNNNMVYTAYLNITVEDEPDTIRFFLNDVEVFNGSAPPSPLKFLDSRTLRCETNRSNPGANITITTGNGKLVPLSSLAVSNATYQWDEKDPTFDFVVPVYRNTTAVVNNWVFDTDAYGKPVVCTARVGRDTPGITTFFIPAVADGPPQIECNDTVYARDGQRNFAIICTSFAKPSIMDASFYFTTTGGNFTIQGFPVGSEHTSGDGKVKGIVQRNDDIKYTLQLTIQMVDLKSGNSFNFRVVNSYGQDIHRVTIKDQSMAASASALSTYLSTFLFICLIGFGIRGQL